MTGGADMFEAMFAIIAGFGLLISGFFLAIYFLLPVWPCWVIAKRAGYSPVWAFLIVIPVVNIIVMWLFAFSRWPNEGNGFGAIDVTAFGTNSQLENRPGSDRG